LGLHEQSHAGLHEGLHDAAGPVGRAIVDHDELEVAAGLLEDASDRALD